MPSASQSMEPPPLELPLVEPPLAEALVLPDPLVPVDPVLPVEVVEQVLLEEQNNSPPLVWQAYCPSPGQQTPELFTAQ